ncbi:unnamed protein product [Ambrosiozyma monospora]|uniref:Unnamed protein product n=1 Tax=Ambrosiozyma monospora TaxID=43982 RepID=A0ACB5T3V4_AMBMO|nr:unnamed protein product [Ambrosiozyma monospora]
MNFDFLKSIPDTLEQLSFIGVLLMQSTSHVVLLIHLKTLVIQGQSDSLTDFEISNFGQLLDLSAVYIDFRKSLCSDAQLKPFVHQV